MNQLVLQVIRDPSAVVIVRQVNFEDISETSSGEIEIRVLEHPNHYLDRPGNDLDGHGQKSHRVSGLDAIIDRGIL